MGTQRHMGTTAPMLNTHAYTHRSSGSDECVTSINFWGNTVPAVSEHGRPESMCLTYPVSLFIIMLFDCIQQVIWFVHPNRLTLKFITIVNACFIITVACSGCHLHRSMKNSFRWMWMRSPRVLLAPWLSMSLSWSSTIDFHWRMMIGLTLRTCSVSLCIPGAKCQLWSMYQWPKLVESSMCKWPVSNCA